MKINTRALIAIVVYIIVFLIASMLQQWVLAIAFTLMWIDKLVLSALQIKSDMGLELITLSSALIGIELGSIIGFFATLILLLALDTFKWFLTYPKSSGEPAFYLTLDLILYPILAVVAFYLSTIVPPILAVLLTLVGRELLTILPGIITGDYSALVTRGLNFIIAVLLLYAISSVFALI